VVEDHKNRIVIWAAQVRGNFLILSVLLVSIGLSLAASRIGKAGTGYFDILHALLLVIGVVLAHSSVNLFNEYSDYRTGIDEHTRRTPFSGGSGMLQAAMTSPRAVCGAAIGTLLAAFSIGIYFSVRSHWFIMVLMGMGGIAIVFYTDFLARWLLGEFFAGLTLGSAVVVGSYIGMIGNPSLPLSRLMPLEVLLVSIPPGILTSLLLFLNEFPDVEADRGGGRYHLVIFLGKERAAYLYSFGLLLVFSCIILLPILGIATKWLFIALLPLPAAVIAAMIAIRHGNDSERFLPALGLNVMVVLGTDALMAAAYAFTLFV
jgi:1,4-dihydroxy-2-naphthoate octaprenyltransferase